MIAPQFPGLAGFAPHLTPRLTAPDCKNHLKSGRYHPEIEVNPRQN